MSGGHGRRIGTGAVALVAVLAATSLGVGVPSPAAAQELPPGTAEASFAGGCVGASNPPGAGIPIPARSSVVLEVPASVEPGSTVSLRTVSVDGTTGPVGRVGLDGRFALTGATPASATVSAFAGSDFSPLTFTVTGAAGSTVDLRLTGTSWVTWVSVPGWFARYDCEAGEPSADEVTISIPIAAPECLDAPATIVGAADATTVTGTSGNDVIVAQAAGATVVPGGGRDRICVPDGGGTLSWAGTRRTVIALLANGTASAVGGGTVRFTGIANVQGSERPDFLVGDGAANTLRGGGGADVLAGLGGADVLDGQAGTDLLLGDSADTCTSGRAIGC
jgi:Ca2+-binding RTX toxin-like protein